MTTTNKLTIEQYIEKIKEGKYLPEKIIPTEEGQIELEKYRFKFEDYQGNLRVFANNITKYWIYPTQGLQLIRYIDERFFSRVLLYFCFISTVENLVLTSKRAEIDTDLRNIINDLIHQYLSTKKRKKQIYSNLTRIEVAKLVDELLNNFWDNLVNMKIINLSRRGVFLNKDNTIDIFDNLVSERFKDYPCVHPPKNWNDTAKYGGYYSVVRSFFTYDDTYAGTLIPTTKLIELINKLQRKPWTYDIPAEYLEQEFSYSLNALIDEVKKGEPDIYQKLHTKYFLKNFNTKVNTLYYPFQLDFRGRTATVCSWYSPTASKKLRKYLRLPKPLALSTLGKDWLALKLGYILGITGNNYSETLNNAKEFINLTTPSKLNIMNNLEADYKKYQLCSILNDLKNEASTHLIQFDATSSVFQILAILFNSKRLMHDTNLIGENSEMVGPNSTFKFKDIYKIVQELSEEELPHPAMRIFFDRKLIKGILMPLPYAKSERESVNDLIDFLKEIENTYLRAPLDTLNLDSPYAQYRALSDTELLALLPPTLKAGFETRLATNNIGNINYYKMLSFSTLFYHHLRKTLFKTYPELLDFEKFFFSSAPLFKNNTYTNDYLTFDSKYFKSKTYRRDSDILKQQKTVKNKRRQLSFRLITEEIDFKKKADAPNYIHSIDAWILYKILDKAEGVQIYPIYDCVLFSPEYANFVLSIIQEAYKEIQLMAKEHIVFSQFHKEGSIEIESKNIFKFEYKEV